MASISSTSVNEILPGLEDFLRSMVNSTNLDTDHRQIATIYLDKLDQLSQLTNQQSSIIDDPSLMNTDIISDEESDDFTDEEDEQPATPSVTINDNQLYNSTPTESNISNSQWYIDTPKTDCYKSLTFRSPNEHDETCSSIIPRRSSTSTSTSSNILADGLLLTYDKNHNWIWRYYVLDNFDLICFSADKKSRLINQEQSDTPLWVSDMTNAKVHTTIIDKIECLCLQIGLAEAIYVRPSDSNEMNIWLKAFRDASSSSSQKSKQNSKTRTNVKTLSRNARRIFAQFNRKKGQIVSHLLDQVANVTGIDDKTRKHYELRGFLVISLDNSTFVTKYCTIIDGIFRIHKSRLSDQTEHQFDLNHCTLSFPEERTRDIQFALINKHNDKIFIRGNNIYSMGRLLNTLAKYVEIKGSSQNVFKSNKPSSPHVYSDLDLSSNNKVLPMNMTKNIYRSASQLYDDRNDVISSVRQTDRNTTPIQQETIPSNEVYDQPTFSDKITTTIDRNNNQISIPPQPRERTKNDYSLPASHSSINLSSYDQTFSPSSTDSISSQHHHHHPRRRPHPLPRRSYIDSPNKFNKLLPKTSNERHISTQTSDIHSNLNRTQPSVSKRVYDIPITIERPTKFVVPPLQRYEKSTCIMDDDDDDDEETTTYDNVSKSDGIGKFRFIIPFNHSPRSAFTTIKPINSSPTGSSSSTISSNSTLPQTSSSSNYSNANTNNNNNNRTRLMTAV